jgi:hypothetical protein
MINAANIVACMFLNKHRVVLEWCVVYNQMAHSLILFEAANFIETVQLILCQFFNTDTYATVLFSDAIFLPFIRYLYPYSQESCKLLQFNLFVRMSKAINLFLNFKVFTICAGLALQVLYYGCENLQSTSLIKPFYHPL